MLRNGRYHMLHPQYGCAKELTLLGWLKVKELSNDKNPLNLEPVFLFCFLLQFLYFVSSLLDPL